MAREFVHARDGDGRRACEARPTTRAGACSSRAALAAPTSCGNQILRRVRAESSRRPPRHRRDTCSMAWRCRFFTARRSQRGPSPRNAPDTLVDFHTGADARGRLKERNFAVTRRRARRRRRRGLLKMPRRRPPRRRRRRLAVRRARLGRARFRERPRRVRRRDVGPLAWNWASGGTASSRRRSRASRAGRARCGTPSRRSPRVAPELTRASPCGRGREARKGYVGSF